MMATPDGKPVPAGEASPSPAGNHIHILLVDGHALVRSGFRRIFETEADIRVAADVPDVYAACQVARTTEIDVTVLGMTMPGLNGAAAATAIMDAKPGATVLIVNGSAEPHCVRRAFDAGAKGYVCMKHALDADMVRAVRTVANGGSYISPELSGILIRAIQSGTLGEDDPYERLTRREKQVLQLIAQGMSAREIAQHLGMSVNTVAVHRANLMNRLGIRKTAGLVVFAVGRGLIMLD